MHILEIKSQKSYEMLEDVLPETCEQLDRRQQPVRRRDGDDYDGLVWIC